MPVRTRRARAVGGRPHHITVWLSDEELAAIADGAERSGMAAGAWLGQVGVAAAEVGPAPRVGSPAARAQVVVAELVGLQNQLRETRRVLRNVGGNLNDVARAANSTGQLVGETDTVARLVARVVESVEATVRQVSGQTSTVMAEYRVGATRAARAAARGQGRS
jgi:hypothetical protein